MTSLAPGPSPGACTLSTLVERTVFNSGVASVCAASDSGVEGEEDTLSDDGVDLLPDSA
jgi:hypothetical protein